MNQKIFRDFLIKRECNFEFEEYGEYKPYLKKDFHSRCAYCNVNDSQITTYFEVDHFIPKSVCEKNKRLDLINNYNNLVYSCKKCNQTKSKKFFGDFTIAEVENEMFYEPVAKDYNELFYRNELGGITPVNDIKAKEMILLLKLYRPIHNLEWISEQLDYLTDRIEKIVDEERNEEKKQIYIEIGYKLLSSYKKTNKFLIANYNNKKYS